MSGSSFTVYVKGDEAERSGTMLTQHDCHVHAWFIIACPLLDSVGPLSGAGILQSRIEFLLRKGE